MYMFMLRQPSYVDLVDLYCFVCFHVGISNERSKFKLSCRLHDSSRASSMSQNTSITSQVFQVDEPG